MHPRRLSLRVSQMSIERIKLSRSSQAAHQATEGIQASGDPYLLISPFVALPSTSPRRFL